LDTLVLSDKEYIPQKERKKYVDVFVYDKEGKQKIKQRLLEDGKLIRPINVVSISKCSDEILEKQIVSLENSLYFGDEGEKLEASRKLSVAYGEREKREDKLCL
jgi:hypothetical protein